LTDPSLNILAKPRFSNAGRGIFIYVGGKLKRDYICQEFNVNHGDLRRLRGNGFCGSIRYVVYNKRDGILPLGTRISLNWGRIANNVGAIYAINECNSGIITTDGFSLNGKTFVTHLVSGLSIKGFRIPHWEK
jgi:hypothetical protein